MAYRHISSICQINFGVTRITCWSSTRWRQCGPADSMLWSQLRGAQWIPGIRNTTDWWSRELQTTGLRSQYRLLGMIPRDDLYALMHASAAVLNPSLSEGWSTTVEEARSLGAPLLLSDLPVHREQAGDEASYFDRYSSDSLAAALARFKVESRLERVARAQKANALAHARACISSRVISVGLSSVLWRAGPAQTRH